MLAPDGDEGSRAAVAHQWRSAAAIVAAGMAVLALVATAVRLDAPADPSVIRPGWSTWRADGVVIDVTASKPSRM
jgi:hypothetical protein